MRECDHIKSSEVQSIDVNLIVLNAVMFICLEP